MIHATTVWVGSVRTSQIKWDHTEEWRKLASLEYFCSVLRQAYSYVKNISDQKSSCPVGKWKNFKKTSEYLNLCDYVCNTKILKIEW